MRTLLKGWLLIVSMTLAFTGAPSARALYRAPLRAVFYYGYPSLVNGANGDVARAASVFAAWDIVVLGDGVEFAKVVSTRNPAGVGPLEHARTRAILQQVQERNPRAQSFGYVCLGDSQRLTLAEVRRRMMLWKLLGVTGIFLDEAGYDWRMMTRLRQNRAIQEAHELGLGVMVNSFYPENLLNTRPEPRRNANNEPSTLTPQDMILLESFPVKNGQFETAPEWKLRLAQALQVRSELGAGIVSLSTTGTTAPITVDQREYACWLAWMFDLEAIGWGEADFSSDSQLHEHPCHLQSLPEKGSHPYPDLTQSDVLSRDFPGGSVVLDTSRKAVEVRTREIGVARKRAFGTGGD